MTGSALARYELRGTFHMRLLRALSGIEGESRGGEGGGSEPGFAPSADFFFSHFSLFFIGFYRFFGPRTPSKMEVKTDLKMASIFEPFLFDF